MLDITGAKNNQEIKRNTLPFIPGYLSRAVGKGIPFLFGGLFILLAVAPLFRLFHCRRKTSSEPAIPEPSELTYSVSISAPPIQISSGNLHWHKELPNDSYTLEDMAMEIYNFGDFDISVAQLEIRVDEDTRLFNIDQGNTRRGKREYSFAADDGRLRWWCSPCLCGAVRRKRRGLIPE